MTKIVPMITKYWYILVLAVLAVVVFLKKKKVTPSESNKDEEAENILNAERIRDTVSKNHYKAVALQIAENMGTAYAWYDPRRWTENDDIVYALVRELNQRDFDIVSNLYFKLYAKGNNLSEDLAKHLDKDLYSLLTIK